jgi:uncharacterized protein (DUF302 family)
MSFIPQNDRTAHEGRKRMTVAGLKTSLSNHGPSETIARAVSVIEELGMTVLARVDHSAAAAKVGMKLRPTEVILFGNPKTGTPLMQEAQTIGIDLPLKLLVWQDEQDRTWIAYNDPFWLAARHVPSGGSTEILEKMALALAKIVEATYATSKQ